MALAYLCLIILCANIFDTMRVGRTTRGESYFGLGAVARLGTSLDISVVLVRWHTHFLFRLINHDQKHLSEKPSSGILPNRPGLLPGSDLTSRLTQTSQFYQPLAQTLIKGVVANSFACTTWNLAELLAHGNLQMRSRRPQSLVTRIYFRLPFDDSSTMCEGEKKRAGLNVSSKRGCLDVTSVLIMSSIELRALTRAKFKSHQWK